MFVDDHRSGSGRDPPPTFVETLSLSHRPPRSMHTKSGRCCLPGCSVAAEARPPMPAAPSVIIINHHQHKPERAGGAPWALALNHTGPPPLLLRLDDGGPLSRSVLSVCCCCCLSVAASCCSLTWRPAPCPPVIIVTPGGSRQTTPSTNDGIHLCGDQEVLVRVVIFLPWRARPSSLRRWRRRRPWCGGS